MYVENVTIAKENLTIRSYSGNPDDTRIISRSAKANAFLVKANNTKINGFNISGATASGYAGIYLNYSNNCTIENNKLLNNMCGIFLWFANRNNVLKNTATNNGAYGGILLQASTFNTVSGNKVYNNVRGINLGTSSDNTLSSNTVEHSTGDLGFFVCGKSPRSLIYNNYFNETNLTIRKTHDSEYVNTLNIKKTAGTNIVGGPFIGGNYWAKPDATGFSQTAVDKDGDGISDSVYTNVSGSTYSDYLPLVIYSKAPAPILPVANFNSNVTSGNVPLNVLFTDTSTNSPNAWNWSFGDKTYSTVKNPMHKYSATGSYTVTLTVNNTAGSNMTTKPNYIKVGTVAPSKPVVAFSASTTSGNAPLNVAFTDTSTNSPNAWNWSFGDKTYSTVRNPTHKYSTAGSYTVSLTATNAAGSNMVTKSAYIKVTTVIKPVAAFSASPTSGKTSLKVQFTDKSTGSPTSWAWNFGDGTATSTVKSPAHTYTKKGKYTVTLTAKNAAGSSPKTMSGYITVS